MSCEPAVIAALGWLPEEDYEFQIGGSDPPEPGYCLDGEPAFTPHGTFIFERASLAYTLTELTGFSIFGVPQFRRGWFLAPATAQANRCVLENETARPLEVTLNLSVIHNFELESGDAVDTGDYFLATWAVTVFEVIAGVSTSSYPKAAYAGYGTDPQVFQVNTTLKDAYRHDLAADRKKPYRHLSFGHLPQLPPGRAYVAEMGAYHLIGPGVANFDAAADTGSYTAGTLGISMLGWSARD